MIEVTASRLSNKITREINKAASSLKTGSFEGENDDKHTFK